MAQIVVLGGGVVGLATAILLARQGHGVTVFERDADPVPATPEDAWYAWDRRGVTQFRMPHILHAAGYHLLESHLPDVREALLAAGGLTLDMTALLPPHIADRAPRAGDARFVTVTGRRPTLEYAVARVAEQLLPVVRGTDIVELLTGPSAAPGIPHITGVRTREGDVVAADLVIDAMGRRSKLPDWLAAIGARRPSEEVEASGFIYYSRFFRSRTGAIPPFRAGLHTEYPSFSLSTIPADSHTWSMTVFIVAGDPALKALRHPTRWTALVSACPLQAQWLEGEPISDVQAMGGVIDRYRRYVVDGAPVATGILSVGDAWACTNPLGGRGVSMGLMHAIGTVEVIAHHLDEPLALARAQDAMTETRLTPWYRHTIARDRHRTAQIQATIHERTTLPPTDLESRLQIASQYDADLFRAALEIAALLAQPQEILARPGVLDRIEEVASTHEPVVPPGPSREELLRMLA